MTDDIDPKMHTTVFTPKDDTLDYIDSETWDALPPERKAEYIERLRQRILVAKVDRVMTKKDDTLSALAREIAEKIRERRVSGDGRRFVNALSIEDAAALIESALAQQAERIKELEEGLRLAHKHEESAMASAERMSDAEFAARKRIAQLEGALRCPRCAEAAGMAKCGMCGWT